MVSIDDSQTHIVLFVSCVILIATLLHIFSLINNKWINACLGLFMATVLLQAWNLAAPSSLEVTGWAYILPVVFLLAWIVFLGLDFAFGWAVIGIVVLFVFVVLFGGSQYGVDWFCNQLNWCMNLLDFILLVFGILTLLFFILYGLQECSVVNPVTGKPLQIITIEITLLLCFGCTFAVEVILEYITNYSTSDGAQPIDVLTFDWLFFSVFVVVFFFYLVLTFLAYKKCGYLKKAKRRRKTLARLASSPKELDEIEAAKEAQNSKTLHMLYGTTPIVDHTPNEQSPTAGLLKALDDEEEPYRLP